LTEKKTRLLKPLHKIFTDVPPHYDLVNRIFTWGMDKNWRLHAARACLTGNPHQILDLACGTGDLTLDLTRMANNHAEITGLDFSEPMLEIARRKIGISKKVKFICGDAGNLPFTDGYFDCIGISFAMRNLTYRNPDVAKHMSEILRVLRPGGRFVIVESSQPENRLMRILDHLYVSLFVYLLGWLLSRNKTAYNYLRISATNYYSAPELKNLLLKTGFSNVDFKSLFFGAVAIHIAVK
jgi:demethylmenaquinone methyltransferase / 2-methoxy-6-polyprenyl-1,4-benzoquinol methylase